MGSFCKGTGTTLEESKVTAILTVREDAKGDCPPRLDPAKGKCQPGKESRPSVMVPWNWNA